MNNEFDIEEQSVWLESLSVKPFDSKGVMLASKIAREVRKRSGAVVSLRDEKAVANLGKAVLEINEEDLNYLFRVLLDSVTKQDARGNAESSNKNSDSKRRRRRSSNEEAVA